MYEKLHLLNSLKIALGQRAWAVHVCTLLRLYCGQPVCQGTLIVHYCSTLIYAFQILVPVIQDGLGWKSVFYLFMLMVSHMISSKLYDCICIKPSEPSCKDAYYVSYNPRGLDFP